MNTPTEGKDLPDNPSLEHLQKRLGFHPVNELNSLLRALQGFDLAYLDTAGTPRGEALAALLAGCERGASGLSDELTQRFFIHAGERPQTSVAA